MERANFFLNIFYFDSIERAKKLKQVLQDKFKFNSIKQYQMILEDATQEKSKCVIELNDSSKRQNRYSLAEYSDQCLHLSRQL